LVLNPNAFVSTIGKFKWRDYEGFKCGEIGTQRVGYFDERKDASRAPYLQAVSGNLGDAVKE
jgi:hypothetical protein